MRALRTAPPPLERVAPVPSGWPVRRLRWPVALVLALAVEGCTKAQWEHACDVMRAAAGLAPLVCELAGARPEDCAKLRAVAAASQEAERRVAELGAACAADRSGPKCKQAIRGALLRAAELARELEQ